ncbi:MAG: hypothetical protein VCA55_13965 [Verrucomicrobiales bacterium]
MQKFSAHAGKAVASFLLSTLPVLAEENDSSVEDKPGFFHQDTDYSHDILNWQEGVTGKPLNILSYGKDGTPDAPGLVLSGAFWGNYLYEKSNTINRFPILSRFPSERNNNTDSAERWLISNAAIAATLRPVSWITGYTQYEFTEVEFPGQEDWQYRKVLVLIGDIERFPFYGYFGRNTVDFGWLDGYNPFTHTVNNHSFRVDSDDPVIALGYAQENLHVVGTLIHSGRQLRVADTEDLDGWGNGAINLSYTLGDRDKNDRELRLGGGYLHSTIYNNDTPHHPGPSHDLSKQMSPDLNRNPAYDLFAEYIHGPLRFGIEYTATAENWPATGEPVESTNLQAAYDFELLGRPSRFSVVFGTNEQGPAGSQFEKLTQLAVGFERKVTDFFTLSAEWVHNEAFVPLINIRSVSDSSVTANALIIGGKIQF